MRRLPIIAAVCFAVLAATAATAQSGVDVNTAGVSELQTLPGIGPAKARAIVEEREQGGPFRSPEDLQRVRGIGPATARNLAPHVRFGGGTAPAYAPAEPHPTPPPAARGSGGSRGSGDWDLDLTEDDGRYGGSAPAARPSPRPAPQPTYGAAPADDPSARININTADAEALTLLNGIGPSKAQAIIAFRTANGPFRSLDDLTQVHGIGRKTLQRLRPRITIQLDLNKACLRELELIGLDPDSAQRIVSFRQDRGPFRRVEDITSVPGFGRGALETLRPFLWVAPGGA